MVLIDFYTVEPFYTNVPKEIRTKLNERGITDEEIWQAHLNHCRDRICYFKWMVSWRESDKIKNKRKLQAKKYRSSFPNEKEMNKLLRYETARYNLLYKAINKLEHLQRLRAGDNVPAPAQIDLNITNG